MKRIVLLSFALSTAFVSFAQLTPFVGCPNVNTAILRSGTNSPNTGAISIYNVNSTTGATSLLSGPILDPANASLNLQINGLGLNTIDGFMYGINSGTPTIAFAFPIAPPMPFYRLGSNAVAQQLGTLTGPAITGGENSTIVSAAAGEMDLAGNYYFSAATGIAVPNFITPSASTFAVTRLFIGQLLNVAGLPTGSSALSPTYVQVTNPSGDAAAYLASVQTATSLSSAQNTGLRDFVFNKYDGNLYAYVTFPDPANPTGNYYGQMLKVNPSTGILSAIAPAVILSFATTSNEVAGTLLDKAGNFLILFTDGKMYKAASASMGIFDGSISLLNGATGLPTSLRGDMASCGATTDGGSLPVTLNNFTAFKQNGTVNIKWQTAAEINVDKFTIQRSADAKNWISISSITAKGTYSIGAQYQIFDNTITQTVYYRLAIIDKNGDTKYSSVKKIAAESGKIAISTYPNPVKNTLIIEGQQAFNSNTNISVSDVTGKILVTSSKRIGENIIHIDVTQLSKGVYFLRVISEAGQVSTSRFIKQ